jgi:hypothetical protein
MQDFKYRPVAAIVSGSIVVLVDVMIAGLDFYVNGIASFLGSLPLYLVIAWVVFVFLFKPSVKVSKESISITNPFRWIQISIQDVEDLDTRRGLVVKTKVADFPVAVGVAPGRYTVARANKQDFKWAGNDGGKAQGVVSPGDILDSDSGAVAFVIRQHLKRLNESSAVSLVETKPVVRTDFVSITIGIVLGLGALVQAVS